MMVKPVHELYHTGVCKCDHYQLLVVVVVVEEDEATYIVTEAS